jgi:hypothetical protein
MRKLLGAALVGVLAACGQPTTTETTSVGSPGAGEIAAHGFAMETEALVGIWSFDRSCASGDGMTLRADDTASYDEWGQGTWATADGNRVVLSLERREMGMDEPTGEHLTLYLDVTAPVTDDLAGRIARDDGTEQREINARRCPSQP